MSSLQIAPDLALPLQAVTETFAILAKRGKGKTNTAVVMTEEMIGAGIPVVVLDPVGVWWGIRSSADGAGDGLPVVIFGGDHADVPLEESAGDLIADVIVDSRISAVIDLSSLSKSASRRFMGPFVERLYHRNREALHVVVDEADAFAPQRPQADGARLLGAMEDLVRRGRARGIGVTLITQRPAVLNKDVLTQAEVLVALGMTGPRDVAAIDEWVRLKADDDQAREVKATLPSLRVGEAWVWSPAWLDVLQRVQIRARRTFDSSATPKPGENRVAPQRLADVDLAALGERITATVERRAADDPKALRRRIAQLEREVEQLRETEPDVELVEVPVVTDADLDTFAHISGQLLQHLSDLEAKIDAVHQLPTEGKQGQPTQRSSARATSASSTTGRAPVAGSSTARKTRPPARETRPGPAAATDGNVHLRTGARRMVQALGRMQPLRLTKGQWGMVAGLKTTGGTWSTYLGELRRLGFIDEDTAGYTLTDAGFDYLGGRPEPLTGAELQDHYRRILRTGAARMLDALIAAYPDPLDTEQLGDAAGIATTGGTFSTYRGDLTRNGLAERIDGGLVATDILMRGASA